MKILVGLTNDCPTEEQIHAFPVELPMELVREKPDGAERVSIGTEEELEAWADKTFEIWALKEG